MNMQVLDARRDLSGGYKVDVARGERVGRVSSEWFSRPDGERFLSLGELAGAVRDRAERSRTRVVESALIHVEASRTDPERLSLILPGTDAPVVPTHWSFGQLTSQVGAPAAYLRQLPAALAGINLQYGLTSHRAEQIKTLETEDGRVELRAVTGPDYGRIYDYELVEAAQRLVALEDVLERPSPGRVHRQRLVRGDRAIDERPLRPAAVTIPELAKRLVSLPALEHLQLEGVGVGDGGQWIEHGLSLEAESPRPPGR